MTPHDLLVHLSRAVDRFVVTLGRHGPFSLLFLYHI